MEGLIQEIFFLSDGSILTGTSNGIYRSDNDGESWEFSGLDDRTVWSFTQNSQGVIFAAASHDGIFRSTGNGLVWEPLNEYTEGKNFIHVAVNSRHPTDMEFTALSITVKPGSSSICLSRTSTVWLSIRLTICMQQFRVMCLFLPITARAGSGRLKILRTGGLSI